MKRYGWLGLACACASHAHAADLRKPGDDPWRTQTSAQQQPSGSSNALPQPPARLSREDLRALLPPGLATSDQSGTAFLPAASTDRSARQDAAVPGASRRERDDTQDQPQELTDYVQRSLHRAQAALQERHRRRSPAYAQPHVAPAGVAEEIPSARLPAVIGQQKTSPIPGFAAAVPPVPGVLPAGGQANAGPGAAFDQGDAWQESGLRFKESIRHAENALIPQANPFRGIPDVPAVQAAEVIGGQEILPVPDAAAIARPAPVTSGLPVAARPAPVTSGMPVAARPAPATSGMPAAAGPAAAGIFAGKPVVASPDEGRDEDGARRHFAPGFTEYVLRARSSVQRQTNPYRVSDDQRGALRPDTVFLNEISGALIVPILSDSTRLVASGNLGNARYQKNRELNYQPKRLDAAFQWRAGDLWQGQVGISGEDSLNRFLTTSAPDRDIVRNRSAFADLGLRVSDSLTLPQLSFQHNSLRYQYPINATTYNRAENRVQAAVRYTGTAASYLQAGVMESRMDYLDRTAAQVATIDNHYVDREGFIDGQWEYSAKTLLQARLGYRQRSYANLAERDVNLVTAETRAAWQYSVKTRFDLDLWHRPYGNEEDPAILYSTLTGVRASIRWQPTGKLWISFNVVRENQKNTRLTAADAGRSKALRFGPRLEWAVNPNFKIVLDGWRDNVEGINYPSSNGTVVRLGVVLSTDNRGTHEPERLLRDADCAAPRYVETTTCYD